MSWHEKILFIVAIEFVVLGGLAFGAAAFGITRWSRRRVVLAALGGLVALGLSLASAAVLTLDQAPMSEIAAPGPTRGEIEAARSMTPEQRRAMIETMIARLTDRLRDNPKDLAGWLRLARAHAVMGRGKEALEAYAAAKRHFPKDAVRIDAMMSTLPAGR